MAKSEHPEEPATLREQGGAVLGGVREAVLHATRHVEALAELLQVELNEYGRRQARRLTAAFLGVAGRSRIRRGGRHNIRIFFFVAHGGIWLTPCGVAFRMRASPYIYPAIICTFRIHLQANSKR